MTYGLSIDIYAPFGFTIFELRDKYQRPLDNSKPSFLPLFLMAKELIIKKAKKTLTLLETASTEDDVLARDPLPTTQSRKADRTRTNNTLAPKESDESIYERRQDQADIEGEN
jgi:hypothetical protein